LTARAKLSIALTVVALGGGAFVASGVGSRSPSPPTATRSVPSSPSQSRLWNDRGCITCHGWNARGTPMGPDLVKIVPLYVARHGSVEAARRALVEYLLDPQGSPKVRDDGVLYPNPMPPVLKMFGGRPEDADALADLLLGLAK
jgi:hypothetical protein